MKKQIPFLIALITILFLAGIVVVLIISMQEKEEKEIINDEAVIERKDEEIKYSVRWDEGLTINNLEEIKKLPELIKEADKLPVLIHGKKRIGQDYDNIYSFFIAEDKVGYIVSQDGKWFLVYDGKEGNKYNMIWMQSSNKILYIAKKESNKNVVVYNNKEGKEYDRISHTVRIIEGKPTYVATINDSPYLIFGDQEIELEGHGYYFNEMNGKLAYGKTRFADFIIYDGQSYEFGTEEYDEFYSNYHRLVESTANKNRRLYGSQVEKKPDYQRIMYQDMKKLDGKLAYVAQKNNGKYVLIYDGVEIGEHNRINIDSLKIINGKITYVANRSKIIHGEKELGSFGDIDRNFNFFEIDGKIIYFVEGKGGHMVIIDEKSYNLGGYISKIGKAENSLVFRITQDDGRI